jgi:hypothetical protein
MTIQVDTGEFLVPEAGFQRAQSYVRELQADYEDRIERLATVMVQNARLMHKQLHPIIEGGMEKCRQVSCQSVRHVLGLP